MNLKRELGIYFKFLTSSYFLITLYMPATPARLPLVTRNRECQFNRPSLLHPSGTGVNSSENVSVFPFKRFSQLFVLLLQVEFLISRSRLCLRSMCSALCLNEPKAAWRFLSLRVGDLFLILSYSKAKQQKCLLCGASSHRDALFFSFLLKIS